MGRLWDGCRLGGGLSRRAHGLYGVNFVLGVGLHSYGFGTGGFGWALLFVATEFALVTLAAIRRAQTADRSRKAAALSKPQLVS